MKRALLLAAAAGMTLAGTAAIAQPYGYYGDYDRRYYDRDYRSDYRERRWSRGQYLPRHYRSRNYVVYDYGRYRLRPPPRGYHWVRHGDDYLLAAIATGLIAQVIFGSNGGYGYSQPYYGGHYR
jgi:hypothetical protein